MVKMWLLLAHFGTYNVSFLYILCTRTGMTVPKETLKSMGSIVKIRMVVIN